MYTDNSVFLLIDFILVIIWLDNESRVNVHGSLGIEIRS